MSLSTSDVEALAPDQASLKAASKLLKPAKWPVLEIDKEGGSMIWGECQGSGANPYRVVVDKADHGYKCTCPSRKFPCKHALALMWIFAEGPDTFKNGSVPEWALDWVSRRRKTKRAPETKGSTERKSLTAAIVAEPEKPLDPKAEARKKAAAKKRAAQTLQSLYTATEELDQWIEDQLRTGISGLQSDLTDRCRKIAARLVDGKAASLAGRIDELPARVLSLDAAIQPEAILTELGKLVLINRTWRAEPTNAELRRLLATAETRQDLIDNPATPKVKDKWEVLGEMIRTRRDGLIAQSTWLLRLGKGDGPRFALLLDFFPASLGARGNTHTPGEQFEAEVAFYPADQLSRAVVSERGEAFSKKIGWPKCNEAETALTPFIEALNKTPWLLSWPLLLGAGRIATAEAGKQFWWLPDSEPDHPLPLVGKPSKLALGIHFSNAAGIWNGHELQLITGNSKLGRISFDD